MLTRIIFQNEIFVSNEVAISGFALFLRFFFLFHKQKLLDRGTWNKQSESEDLMKAVQRKPFVQFAKNIKVNYFEQNRY